MVGSRSMRLVQTSLRCYPQRWRSRHGEEAAELARLLMRDGKPARTAEIDHLEFVKGEDDTAPVVVAVTVEGPE